MLLVEMGIITASSVFLTLDYYWYNSGSSVFIVQQLRRFLAQKCVPFARNGTMDCMQVAECLLMKHFIFHLVTVFLCFSCIYLTNKDANLLCSMKAKHLYIWTGQIVK